MFAYRDESEYKDHPRITWLGIGGSIAYVDYSPGDRATARYCALDDGKEGFKVIEPDTFVSMGDVRFGFDTIDEAIEYALTEAGR